MCKKKKCDLCIRTFWKDQGPQCACTTLHYASFQRCTSKSSSWELLFAWRRIMPVKQHACIVVVLQWSIYIYILSIYGTYEFILRFLTDLCMGVGSSYSQVLASCTLFPYHYRQRNKREAINPTLRSYYVSINRPHLWFWPKRQWKLCCENEICSSVGITIWYKSIPNVSRLVHSVGQAYFSFDYTYTKECY